MSRIHKQPYSPAAAVNCKLWIAGKQACFCSLGQSPVLVCICMMVASNRSIFSVLVRTEPRRHNITLVQQWIHTITACIWNVYTNDVVIQSHNFIIYANYCRRVQCRWWVVTSASEPGDTMNFTKLSCVSRQFYFIIGIEHSSYHFVFRTKLICKYLQNNKIVNVCVTQNFLLHVVVFTHCQLIVNTWPVAALK